MFLWQNQREKSKCACSEASQGSWINLPRSQWQKISNTYLSSLFCFIWTEGGKRGGKSISHHYLYSFSTYDAFLQSSFQRTFMLDIRVWEKLHSKNSWRLCNHTQSDIYLLLIFFFWLWLGGMRLNLGMSMHVKIILPKPDPKFLTILSAQTGS